MSKMKDMEKKLQEELENFKKMQKQQQKVVSQQTQLRTQLQENEMVKSELVFCKSGSKIYKMTGSVLVPTSLDEANSNVQRRIDYIQREIKRNEAQQETLKQDILSSKDSIENIDKQLKNLKIKAAC